MVATCVSAHASGSHQRSRLSVLELNAQAFRQRTTVLHNEISTTGLMPLSQISGQLATDAALFAANVYTTNFAQKEAVLERMRLAYFNLQGVAQGMPVVEGVLGTQILQIGNLLQQLGYLVLPSNTYWAPTYWQGAYHPWWGGHIGWGYIGWPSHPAWYGGGWHHGHWGGGGFGGHHGHHGHHGH
jgi:hypothetical protein